MRDKRKTNEASGLSAAAGAAAAATAVRSSNTVAPEEAVAAAAAAKCRRGRSENVRLVSVAVWRAIGRPPSYRATRRRSVCAHAAACLATG